MNSSFRRTRGREAKERALIRFTDFMTVPEPGLTKVKFNIRAGVGGAEAWECSSPTPRGLAGHDRHRERHQNNNLDRPQYPAELRPVLPLRTPVLHLRRLLSVALSCPSSSAARDRADPLPSTRSTVRRLIIKLEKRSGGTSICVGTRRCRTASSNPRCTNWHPTPSSAHSRATRTSAQHHELQRIIATTSRAGKDALSSVKGVYVITDLSSGRLYVGSALARPTGSGRGGPATRTWQPHRRQQGAGADADRPRGEPSSATSSTPSSRSSTEDEGRDDPQRESFWSSRSTAARTG